MVYIPNDDACTEFNAECTVEGLLLGYLPNLGANAFFAAFFLICAVFNLYAGIKFKTWSYMTALTLGCICEAAGYMGRILMNKEPFGEIGFELQITCLIIAPAFVSAGIYLTLKHFVITFGESWSRLRPAWYTYVFITGDVISLILQGAGGGMAAAGESGSSTQDLGTNLMIAGVVFQVIILSAFITLAGEYMYKTYQRRNQLSADSLKLLADKKFRAFIAGVAIAFLSIFARCIYRIPELTGGWGNELMRKEIDFIILEGVAITIAVFTLTFIHPGFSFPQLARVNRPQANRKTFDEEGSMEIMPRSS